jgi:acetyltransferase-like isoleucine patch superfamily enzyme
MKPGSVSSGRPYPEKSLIIRFLEAVMPLFFFSLAAVVAGVALGAAIGFYGWFSSLLGGLGGESMPGRLVVTGISLGFSYYAYGWVLMVVIPAACLLLGSARLKPYRGPAVSVRALPWYIHNAMVFVARYSFLDFVTPTIYLQIFYRLMGMKIGRDVMINSTAITDLSLIELGDRATIGGSASVIAHYGQGGYLVVSPVKIGAGATIGLRATVMAGVEVGEGAKVLANSFVLPNTRIPPGETWGGVPAAKWEPERARALSD